MSRVVYVGAALALIGGLAIVLAIGEARAKFLRRTFT